MRAPGQMPWTASRPAPHKLILLRPGGASLDVKFFLFSYIQEGGQLITPFCRIGIIQPLPLRRGIAIALGAIVLYSFGNRMSRDVRSAVVWFSSHSHLTSVDKLQRSQGNLEVGSVVLEIEQSLSNVLLKLGGVLPRGAVGGDLVDGAHLVCGDAQQGGWMSEIVAEVRSCPFGSSLAHLEKSSLNWGFRALLTFWCALAGGLGKMCA